MSFLHKYNYSRIAVNPAELSEGFAPDDSQKNTENKFKSFMHIFYTSVSGRHVSKSSIIPIPIPEKDLKGLKGLRTLLSEQSGVENIRSPSWKKYEKHLREDGDIMNEATFFDLRNSTGLQSTSLNEFLSISDKN